MPVGTVKVEGLKELNRALGKMAKDTQKELRTELKKLAEPVAADARLKAGRFGPKTAAGIAAGTAAGGAVVRQRRKRTTGKRPDFGRRIMETALEPALAENERKVLAGVEKMLDRVADEAGF